MRHTAVPSRRGRGCGRGGPARCDPGGPPLRRGAAAEGAQRGGRADRGGWGFWRAPARPYLGPVGLAKLEGVLTPYKRV